MGASVRVRFSPSPTGFLHIGGARTALYNWLFARHHKGTFILRIEDTDRQRSTKEFELDILEGLKWLGLDWDEGPVFQSQRLVIYKKFAEELVSKGHAFYIEEDGRRAIRFKMEEGKTIEFDDLIRGKITFDATFIEDFVILKADGFPTYNFACVVDDMAMNITHIIRGDDHIPNTPKQIALYHALGGKMPAFAHLPMILGEDGARLSKRHGATAVTEYRNMGYLPDALGNFIALLGWSPGNDIEIVSRQEMIEKFSIENVGKTSARFNQTKLDWMNSQYIRQLPVEKIIEELRPFFLKEGIDTKALSVDWFTRLIEVYKERFKTLQDFLVQTSIFFHEELEYDEAAVDKFLKPNGITSLLEETHTELSRLEDFDTQSLENCLRALTQRHGIGFGKLAQPLRVALTGKTVSAGLFEIMELLGKDKTLRRLEHCLETFLKRQPK